MTHDLETVFTATDELNAEVVKLALESVGIRCVIDNEHQAGFAGVFPAKVQVRAEDADKARQIIEKDINFE